MNILTVAFTSLDNSSVLVTFDNGRTTFAPARPGNRIYDLVLRWVAAGNTITPYQPPQVPNPLGFAQSMLGNRPFVDWIRSLSDPRSHDRLIEVQAMMLFFAFGSVPDAQRYYNNLKTVLTPPVSLVTWQSIADANGFSGIIVM